MTLTANEDVLLVPFNIPEDGADAVRCIWDQYDLVPLGADKFGNASPERAHIRCKLDAHEPIRARFDLTADFFAVGGYRKGERSIGPW